MKVTIDSTEPLSDALRVLGAIYDVKVVVAEEDVMAVPTTAGSGPAPFAHKVRAQTAKKKLAAEPGTTLDNVEIRSWAVENGLTVSNRGRLPARVVAAYRDAHQI